MIDDNIIIEGNNYLEYLPFYTSTNLPTLPVDNDDNPPTYLYPDFEQLCFNPLDLNIREGTQYLTNDSPEEQDYCNELNE